jgi:drug/metabolite transporter (DMT)-like permease
MGKFCFYQLAHFGGDIISLEMSGGRDRNAAIWRFSVSGLIILPMSFVALTSATRHTNAANVSLFMFLETILGSFWVWLGVGERPGLWMIMGGTIVLGSLSVYILSSMRDTRSS